MSKYYVSCMDVKEVVNAEDPIDACIAVSVKSSMISVGLTWLVSEKGFDIHFDDIRIPDSEILKEMERRKPNFDDKDEDISDFS